QQNRADQPGARPAGENCGPHRAASLEQPATAEQVGPCLHAPERDHREQRAADREDQRRLPPATRLLGLPRACHRYVLLAYPTAPSTTVEPCECPTRRVSR